MSVKVRGSGSNRSSYWVVGLIAALAAGAIVWLLYLSAEDENAQRTYLISARQVSLSHQLTGAAHRVAEGAPEASIDLAATLPTLDQNHYGLRYGDQVLGVEAGNPLDIDQRFETLEPTFRAVRSSADQVLAGNPEAASDLLASTAEFREQMSDITLSYQSLATATRERLERNALAILLAAFATAIVVFILAPVVKRARNADLVGKLRTRRPDYLTGLIRRHPFVDATHEAVARAIKHGELATVLFVDVDNLTSFNRRYGRATGDRLLQHLAERLRQSLRGSDTIARWEDDRFAVLTEHNHRSDDSGTIARKILDAVEEPFLLDRHSLAVTVSIGIAVAPSDGTEADELVERAQIALSGAKQLGRNTFQYYSPELRDLTHGRLQLLDSLRRALADGGELRLAYQPKIDLREGSLAGVEALVRWSHPERGEVLPGEFIPVAEESDLIIGLGRWVIETACHQVATWNASALGSISVSVNVSARQFRHGDLTEVVAGAIDRSGINPEQLEIELTEGILMDDIDLATETLLSLQELGVSIAIDDFGTGYSSLSYLKRFPIDSLKIDQSFIRELTEGSEDAAISTAIIALAHSLDLEVVAEGVEARQQLAVLEQLDCDIVQGFLFARPLPANALPGFLRRLPTLIPERYPVERLAR